MANQGASAAAWWVGGAAVALAIIELAGVRSSGWVLLVAGVALLGWAGASRLRDPEIGPALRQSFNRVSSNAKWAVLGTALLVFGSIAYFGPRDVGLALSAIGLALLVGGVAVLVLGRDSPTASGLAAAPTEWPVAPSVPSGSNSTDGYTRVAENFRVRAMEVAFQHARRASQMSYVIGLVLFLAGLSLIGFLAYSVYQIQQGGRLSAQATAQAGELAASITTELQRGGTVSWQDILSKISPLALIVLQSFTSSIAFFISALVLAIVGLGLLTRGSRLIQRPVLQETLAELGPLQTALAGLPPRKPAMQVAEQSLEHSRRALMLRLRFSAFLGMIGAVALAASLAVAVMWGGFSWVATAAVGGVGVLAYLVSLVTNRQSEIKKALEEIVETERRVAQYAQQAEIVDLYVAHLLKSDDGFKSAEDARAVLDLLEMPNPSTRANGASAGSGERHKTV